MAPLAHRPGAQRNRSMAAMMDGLVVCWLCDSPLASTTDTMALRKCHFHRRCMAAVRCHRRSAADSTKRAAIGDEMVHNRMRWRKKVMPLIREDGHTRSALARAASKRLSMEEINYEDTQTVRSRKIVNKRRFKSYRAFWDHHGSESASSDFGACLLAQGRAYCVPGEDRVAMSDNEEERFVQGETVLSRASKDAGVGGMSSASGHGGGVGDNGHDPDRRGPHRGGRDRQRERRRDGKPAGSQLGDGDGLRDSRSSRRRSRTRAPADLPRQQARIAQLCRQARCGRSSVPLWAADGADSSAFRRQHGGCLGGGGGGGGRLRPQPNSIIGHAVDFCIRGDNCFSAWNHNPRNAEHQLCSTFLGF